MTRDVLQDSLSSVTRRVYNLEGTAELVTRLQRQVRLLAFGIAVTYILIAHAALAIFT